MLELPGTVIQYPVAEARITATPEHPDGYGKQGGLSIHRFRKRGGFFPTTTRSWRRAQHAIYPCSPRQEYKAQAYYDEHPEMSTPITPEGGYVAEVFFRVCGKPGGIRQL